MPAPDIAIPSRPPAAVSADDTILPFEVVALDLRGRGKSEGERFYVEDVADYVSDVAATVALATSRHPGLRVFLLGGRSGVAADGGRRWPAGWRRIVVPPIRTGRCEN